MLNDSPSECLCSVINEPGCSNHTCLHFQFFSMCFKIRNYQRQIFSIKCPTAFVHEPLQNFVSTLEFTPPLIMLCGEFVLMSKLQVLLTPFSNWVCGSVGKAQLKCYHSSAVTRVWCPSMGLTSTGCFASVDILFPKEVFHYHDTLKNYNHLVLYNASDSLLSFLFLQLFRRKKSTN